MFKNNELALLLVAGGYFLVKIRNAGILLGAPCIIGHFTLLSNNNGPSGGPLLAISLVIYVAHVPAGHRDHKGPRP